MISQSGYLSPTSAASAVSSGVENSLGSITPSLSLYKSRATRQQDNRATKQESAHTMRGYRSAARFAPSVGLGLKISTAACSSRALYSPLGSSFEWGCRPVPRNWRRCALTFAIRTERTEGLPSLERDRAMRDVFAPAAASATPPSCASPRGPRARARRVHRAGRLQSPPRRRARSRAPERRLAARGQPDGRDGCASVPVKAGAAAVNVAV